MWRCGMFEPRPRGALQPLLKAPRALRRPCAGTLWLRGRWRGLDGTTAGREGQASWALWPLLICRPLASMGDPRQGRPNCPAQLKLLTGEGASEQPTGVKSMLGFAGLGSLTRAAPSSPSPASASREQWAASGLHLPPPLRRPPVLIPRLRVASEHWLAPGCRVPSAGRSPSSVLALTLRALASPHPPSRVLYLLCASTRTNSLEGPPGHPP